MKPIARSTHPFALLRTLRAELARVFAPVTHVIGRTMLTEGRGRRHVERVFEALRRELRSPFNAEPERAVATCEEAVVTARARRRERDRRRGLSSVEIP